MEFPNDPTRSDPFRPFKDGALFRPGAKKQKEELEWFRNHDSVTGFPNRALLLRDFAQLDRKQPWAAVLIRINGFMQTNSIFGVELIADMVQRICPPLADFAEQTGGQVYRVSPDRLVLLAPVPDRERLLAGLNETLRGMEDVPVEDVRTVYNYHFTFPFIGYCLTDDPNDYWNAEDMLTVGNFALQNEKAAKGVLYDMHNRPEWVNSRELLPDVQGAWRNGEFEAFYQPVYDLRKMRPVGAELLLRWRHPERGLIPPSDFLPLIETKGMMMEMDLYMLDAACRQIREWMDEELVTVPLSINICRQNIYRADFLPRLIEIVSSYEIPPVMIELELSEAAILYEKNEEFLYMVDQLHRIGFTLTMDNFAATELTSANLLRDLPLDIVKIDRHFLDRVEESDRDRIFVVNILRMIKEMGVNAVATGIETPEQAAQWLELGCTTGQGFHLSHPLTKCDFEKLIF